MLRQLIINGHNAPKDRYPYFSTLNHDCGGALIAPDVIISAGHCMPSDLNAVSPAVGRYSYLKEDHDSPQIFDIVAMERHPQWEELGEDEFRNDFAILFLNETVVDIPYIEINRNPNVPLPQQNLTAMGVGVTSNDWEHAEKAMVLQEVVLNYLPNQQCELASNADTLAQQDHDAGELIVYKGRIHVDQLCTTGGPQNERDSCNYDSGSPIIIQGETPEEDILVALVSFGIDCANPDFPAANSRISSAVDFITHAICKHSMDPPPEFKCGETTTAPIQQPTDDDITTTTTTTFTNDNSSEPHVYQLWEKIVAGLGLALCFYWLSNCFSSVYKAYKHRPLEREGQLQGFAQVPTEESLDDEDASVSEPSQPEGGIEITTYKDTQ